jgi:hypothetical protein
MQDAAIEVAFGGSRSRVWLERLRLRAQRQRKFWRAALWSMAKGYSQSTQEAIDAFREEGLVGSARLLARLHRSCLANAALGKVLRWYRRFPLLTAMRSCLT